MSGDKGYILLIDDEEDIAAIHARSLTQEGYRVKTASDGESALTLLKSEEFDLVISDINLPNLSGLEVLKWVRGCRPELKVILMTGFKAEHAPQEAIDLGCHGFLAKPVSKAELIGITKDALSTAPDDKLSAKNYARIPIDSFMSGRKVEFSLYVRLNEARFLKIAHCGDDIDLPRILELRDRGVTELWIEQADLEKYSRMSQNLAKISAARQDMQENTRHKLLLNACEVAAEELRLSGINEKSVESAKNTLQMAIDVLSAKGPQKDVLTVFSSASPTSYSRAATCGCLCGLIAQVMGWNSHRTVLSLTLAGFLHDVGMYSLPQGLQDKPINAMTPEEYDEYRKHPQYSVERLKANLKDIPQETLTAIAEHHELATPESFPKGLSRTAIFPMAKIVSLIDIYVDAMVELPTQSRTNPAELVRVLETMRPRPLDDVACEALALLIKLGDVTTARERFKRQATNRPNRG